MKLSKLIMILAIIILLTIGISTIIYSNYKVKDVMTLEMSTGIRFGGIGVTKDTDGLRFGMAPPGSNLSRSVKITNPYDKSIKVSIGFYGEMENMTRAEPNDLLLGPNEGKDVMFITYLPPGEEEINFTGYTKIFFLRP